jgi:hypothetical protein
MEITDRLNNRVFDDIINQYRSMIIGIIIKHKLTDEKADHAYQAGMISVWEAILKWEPKRSKFHYFVKFYVGRKMMQIYVRDYIKLTDSVSLDELIEHEEISGTAEDANLIHQETEHALREVFMPTDLHKQIGDMLAEGYKPKEIVSKLKIKKSAFQVLYADVKRIIKDSKED